MQTVTEFVIKRSVWLRGEGNKASKLYRSSDGKQCCVGIYLEACGVPRAALTDRGEPEWGRNRLPPWMTPHGERLFDLFEDNDNEELTQSQREYRIARDFAAVGITVSFED